MIKNALFAAGLSLDSMRESSVALFDLDCYACFDIST